MSSVITALTIIPRILTLQKYTHKPKNGLFLALSVAVFSKCYEKGVDMLLFCRAHLP